MQPAPVPVSNKKNIQGLTLIEILISVLILALVMIGVGNIFISAKRLMTHSRSRMTGAELSRGFADPMQMQVRQDTWGTAANCLGTGNCPNQTIMLDRNYTVSYNVTPNVNVAGANVSRVVFNISWNETD